MDIRLTPDATLPYGRLHVSADVDEELLAALADSDFDVFVGSAEHGPTIRMSPSLVEDIVKWMSFQGLASRSGERTGF